MPLPLQTNRSKAEVTDFSLLLTRLEKAAIHGETGPDFLSTLSNKTLWTRLETGQQMRWATIAQIAEQPGIAVDVYTAVTMAVPDFLDGWIELFDLLEILGRKTELAAAVARARPHVNAERLARWKARCRQDSKTEPSTEMETASEPFKKMLWKQELLEHYLSLFSGREDMFARQWADRKEKRCGYVPVRQPMTLADVDDHVSGRRTYGIYLLRADSTVKCGVIDADLVASLRNSKMSAEDKALLRREKTYMVSQICQSSESLSLKPLIEFSGYKGFHFWYFFQEPTKAGRVKQLLRQVAEPVNNDLKCFDLEVFPKQEQLKGKGFGNLVKIPLGIHRRTGKQSFFIGCAKRDPISQLQFLKQVVPVSCQAIEQAGENSSASQVVLHPRVAGYAKEYPELFRLESLCPPLGQLISICRGKKDLSAREEKILFQTIGFLSRGKLLLHFLMAFSSEYNPHMVNFRLSKVRGTPLGCRRIHSLLGFVGNFCSFDADNTYSHPLLHLDEWKRNPGQPGLQGSRIENLQDAIENMKTAIVQVQRFI